MYPIESKNLQGLRGGRWSGVGPNVFFLGLTSFLTDISSEMVASILPIYMVFVLRLTPLQIGVVDGLYQGAAALARLAGGLFADRWRRNREVAAAGYGLSALCKLGLLAVGSAWGPLSGVIALDRVGKGLRTAPRDALISLSSEPAAPRPRLRGASRVRHRRCAARPARGLRDPRQPAPRLRHDLRVEFLHRDRRARGAADLRPQRSERHGSTRSAPAHASPMRWRSCRSGRFVGLFSAVPRWAW